MLDIGSTAPNFHLPNHSFKNIELASLKGKKVILYFYPKDMTPGCTKEACDLRDHYKQLKALNTEVIGISKDSVGRHKKFIETYDLPFTLLSDEDGSVCQKYSVWVEKSMFGKKYMGIQRATYLIDEWGKIAYTWPKVSVLGHAQDIISKIKEK